LAIKEEVVLLVLMVRKKIEKENPIKNTEKAVNVL